MVKNKSLHSDSNKVTVLRWCWVATGISEKRFFVGEGYLNSLQPKLNRASLKCTTSEQRHFGRQIDSIVGNAIKYHTHGRRYEMKEWCDSKYIAIVNIRKTRDIKTNSCLERQTGICFYVSCCFTDVS